MPLGNTRATPLLSHLSTGEPATPPVDADVATVLRLNVFLEAHDTTLYADFDSLPTALALRWAKLLATAMAPAASSFTMAFPDDRHWPEALLTYSAGGRIDGHVGSARADKVSAATFEALLTADGLPPSALLVSALASPVGNYDPDLARHRQRTVMHRAGYAGHLDRHPARPWMTPDDEISCLHVLRLLETAHDATLARVATEIARMGRAAPLPTRRRLAERPAGRPRPLRRMEPRRAADRRAGRGR